jgi:hypothetical protein
MLLLVGRGLLPRDGRPPPGGKFVPVVVIPLGKTLQVGQGVVEGVLVPVVNLVAGRDRPVVVSPHVAVKPAEPPGGIAVPAAVVDPVAPILAERVPPVHHAVEPDADHAGVVGRQGDDIHDAASVSDSAVSPYRSRSIRTKPVDPTQTGWLWVPVRAAPLPNRTVITRAAAPVIPAARTRRYPSRVSTRSPARTRSIGTGPRAVVTSVPATRQWSLSGIGSSLSMSSSHT